MIIKITLIKQAERRKPGGGESWERAALLPILQPQMKSAGGRSEDRRREATSPVPLLTGKYITRYHYPGDGAVSSARAENLGPVFVCYKTHSMNCLPEVGLLGKGGASSWESQRKPWDGSGVLGL